MPPMMAANSATTATSASWANEMLAKPASSDSSIDDQLCPQSLHDAIRVGWHGVVGEKSREFNQLANFSRRFVEVSYNLRSLRPACRSRASAQGHRWTETPRARSGACL